MPPDPAIPPCTVRRLGLVEYQEAWGEQRRLVQACREDGHARLLLLEHPPTYTFGARGRKEHLLLAEEALAALGAVAHRVDRGGDITYHGPGQLVGYPIVDLRRWKQGPVWYVRSLEQVLIDTLARFDLAAGRVPGQPGVWVGEAKIAAIGVHVSRGITSHGFALNVDPDLRYFSHIVPCGLADASVTSLAQVLQYRTMNGAASGHERMPPPSGGGREPPRESSRPIDMDTVMDAVVDSFAHVFDLKMQETNEYRSGGQLPAQGDRMVAPTRPIAVG